MGQVSSQQHRRFKLQPYTYTRSVYISKYSCTVITGSLKGSTNQDAICQDTKNSEGYEVNPDLQEPKTKLALMSLELEWAYNHGYKKLEI